MAVITVMYPNSEGSTFDLDYYTNTHLPMVAEKWGSMGLQGARVLKGASGAEPGSSAPYACIAIVDFESIEAFGAAVEAHGEAVFGDIPNFTNVEPVVQISEALG